MLGDRGLIVYDSSDPAAKPLVSQVFARELSMPGETARLAALAGSDLVARGYHSQVTPRTTASRCFISTAAAGAIRQQDGRFVVGDERVRGGGAAGSRRPNGRPAFSPNVLLRPIVQDTLFPTICYVAGPNELAYLGQLRGVYEHFGVPMPLMYPRASATLLDSAALRFLTKYKLPLESAAGAGRSGAQRAAQDADSAGRSRRRSASAARAIDDADGAADRRRCRRSIRRSKAPRDRRSAGCSTTCRRCTAR